MPDIDEALASIASSRTRDPLAPVTVIAPSHASALQLRRRLAAHGPFAAVRFETLPRVAELLGAGHLAAQGRSPLARPIGDYVAQLVARESRGALADVGALPGYARVLRDIFRRLRRAGITSSRDITIAAVAQGPSPVGQGPSPVGQGPSPVAAGLRDLPPGRGGTAANGHLAEVLRLYDLFRERTAAFYDEEDLLDAAAGAVRSGRSGFLADLGDVHVVPPGPQTSAGNALLDALRAARSPHPRAGEGPGVRELGEPSARPQEAFLVAPDPASEAQEVVRIVIDALEAVTPLHDIAVFHGAGEGYGRLLREAFTAAGVPSVPLPGIPVAETRAGRGVLALARLPQLDYSRTATIDFLSVAPIPEWLPGAGGDVRERASSWDKISRDAAVTHAAWRWSARLGAYIQDREDELATLDPVEDEARIAAFTRERDDAARLNSVVEALIGRLERLREPQPAAAFIDEFKAVVRAYLLPDASGLAEALEEIDQLGTVGAVGGEFTLSTFAEALGANLEARAIRPERIGDGVIIAGYRAAAGMRFQRVVLCGAYEGAFPAGPGTDAILDDRVWASLKESHPYIEDVASRIERAREAALRAVAAAGDGGVTWAAPAYEPGGLREYYPSPMMAEAFSRVVGHRVTASELRRTVPASALLRRPPSPLSVALRGPVLHSGELSLREAVALVQRGDSLPPGHERSHALQALRSRRSGAFTEWDGNLSALADDAWLELQRAVSPTSLEEYAVCGFRYFCKSLLRLQVVEEPDERQVMDPKLRGSLIHSILERFFTEQHALGRPAVREAWTPEDAGRLMQITDEALEAARRRGQTGLDVFAAHEARTIRADLARFLEADTIFRAETGAVPAEFEVLIPETEIAGVRLRGRVDRIDRTPGNGAAWVIDYKTGSNYGYDKMDRDPLDRGRKLQLPVYLAAVRDAASATAMYWFITQRGGFERPSYVPAPDLEARFRATLEAIVRGIGAGAFPAVSDEENEYRNRFENCTFCDFDRICSRRRDLEFTAKAEHPDMRHWRSVAAAAAPEGDAP